MTDEIYTEEEENLELCISRIDEIIDRDERFLVMPKENAPVFGEAARDMRQKKKENIRNLSEARQSPYFGRIDFARETTPDNIESYYLGEYHIPLDYVFNWRAPIGKLFYSPSTGEYTSPAGKTKVAVNLKRELLIKESTLLDVVETPLLPSGEKVTLTKQTRIARHLSEPKTELKKIVATIQPEQYELIASTPYQVLIVQGVAGSGKSEVGIHRIAYLLSPFNELKLDISPKRVVFFGPSRVFLKYVSNLLPGLGVERVKQMTISEWLRSTLPRRTKPSEDKLLEKLLRVSRKDLSIEVKVAKQKTSLQMAYILDRYVKTMLNEFINNATSITSGKVTVSRSKVRKIIKELSAQPLNEQRRMAISNIEQEFRIGLLTKIDDSQRKDITAQLDKFWPELDFRSAYLKLLSDREHLLKISKGALTEKEADYFGKSLFGKSKRIKPEDLAAICYLNYLLNGINERSRRRRVYPLFEHVVIDEAQDVSPIEFLLLYIYSSNKSFTILGDIGQSLLPHRGITDWTEVKRVFSKEWSRMSITYTKPL